MKKWFRAAIVAASVTPLLAAAAPQASADEDPVSSVLDGSRVDVFVPRIISICVRVGSTCPGHN